MNESKKRILAAISSIMASLALMFADILLGGRTLSADDYPLFSVEYVEKVDINLILELLAIPTERLQASYLIIVLCVPLLLPAMWLIYQSFADSSKWYAIGTYFVLMAGATLTPLLHANFFFIGEIYKAILHTSQVAHPNLLEIGSLFIRSHYIGWAVALFILMVGWLGYALCIFLGKTILPRWSGLMSPFLLLIVINLIFSIGPESLRITLSKASLTISYFIFFIFLISNKQRKDLLK
ncbi:MAG: DUF6796 family protein [Bacteroidota bacterium]